ncbi:27758_t:CDS:2 [Gigaspora margarita]|uniref:27758_t:CDS:1 n=1 Tax=Gigaspora margarita TaxID=4874 RepID=A0ABN7VEE1_GIGMA|nr:27758_t:CDS:2 [Gigaspora margarita]
MLPILTSKKTRSKLNNAQRKQICEYHVKNLSAKHQDIADEFKRRYSELNLERSTVTKIFKKKDQYLHIEENTATQNQYKNRGPKYPLIEKAMNIWVGQVSAAGLVLIDELVKSKGHEFGSLFGISEDELKFSNGWVTNYKKQNSLHRYKLHGEAASAPLESLPNERIKLQNLFSQYELEDIYNADETGSPESSNNTNKTLSVNNVESNAEAHVEDHAKAHAEDHVEAQAEDHAEAQAEDHTEAQAEDHVEAHVEGPAETHMEKQEPTPILLVDETKNLLRR